MNFVFCSTFFLHFCVHVKMIVYLFSFFELLTVFSLQLSFVSFIRCVIFLWISLHLLLSLFLYSFLFFIYARFSSVIHFCFTLCFRDLNSFSCNEVLHFSMIASGSLLFLVSVVSVGEFP